MKPFRYRSLAGRLVHAYRIYRLTGYGVRQSMIRAWRLSTDLDPPREA